MGDEYCVECVWAFAGDVLLVDGLCASLGLASHCGVVVGEYGSAEDFEE